MFIHCPCRTFTLLIKLVFLMLSFPNIPYSHECATQCVKEPASVGSICTWECLFIEVFAE